MNGATVDRQVRFVLQVGKTVMDGDKNVADDILVALRDYGFKDAQILGVVAMKDNDPSVSKLIDAVEVEEELPRDDFKADIIENTAALKKAGY